MRILHHINIVALLAIIFELGHYGIIMEYVLHGSLDDFLYNYIVRRSVSAFPKTMFPFVIRFLLSLS